MFKTIKKIKKLFYIFIFVLFFILILSLGLDYSADEIEYGITFSKKQAIDLDLDWQTAYLAILDELQIKKLRLSAYWDEVENTQNEFNWEDLDWQINEASQRNVEIILAIGGRLPRWPECHFPEWTDDLSSEEKNKATLNYIEQTINRYKDNPQIIAWQIENEPFLSNFGECPDLDKDLLDAEINLAKQINDRPIIVTDSGELSLWVQAASRADIFGTTMYRDTYSEKLGRYIHYPITPGFFHLKKNLVSLFAKPQKWIVIELQAEPWGPVPYQNLTQEERDKTMSLQKFQDMLKFAQKTGFKEFYLWGAEWWYWEKETQDNPVFWEEAKNIFVTDTKITEDNY